MLNIRLPDGSSQVVSRPGDRRRGRRVDRPRPGQGRARRQGRRQAGRHQLRDRSRRRRSRSSPTRIPKALDVIRHSTAHLLAHAVKELFPGRAGDDRPGDRERLLLRLLVQAPVHARGPGGDREADGRAREEGRAGRARGDGRATRRSTFFEVMGEDYKAEIIAVDPGRRRRSRSTARATSSTCAAARTCRRTGKLKAFKLMKVAGAYWRGDSQATRCCSASTARPGPTKEELRTPTCTRSRRPRSATTASSASSSTCSTCRRKRRAWCSGIRRAGRSGRQVEQYMRARLPRQRLPGSARARRSSTGRCGRSPGHWDNYRENMFITESEKRDYALKPMNCPGHVQIFNAGPAQLPRPAAALRRVRRVPPQRALGRAARHHARARLHAGRRPHLLHRGPDRARGASPSTALAA